MTRPAPPESQGPPPRELERWLRDFIERLAEADAGRDYAAALAVRDEDVG